MNGEITCFNAYDVRGRIPDELNEDISHRIGQAYAEVIKPQSVVVGHDIRFTSESLKAALIEGLREQGVDVIDIGLCGTEEIYFATSYLSVGGGIAVTASHNPKDYNGMKFVREESRPISGDSDLRNIQALVEANTFVSKERCGELTQVSTLNVYIQHLLGYINVAELKPLKIVVNAGNGGAGRIIDCLERYLPFSFIRVHDEPDGSFPHGVPNPLLPENREVTAQIVREQEANLGLAWDGDFDRCFFFTAEGKFVEGYYIVGLLAEAFLTQYGSQRIVHDPRLTWNTCAIVEAIGGKSVQSKTGHAFVKDCMRKADAIYGGEMSAHHYFRDFFYCDSGMIPWLLVTALMSQRGQSLAEMVRECELAFPCSGEINREVSDAETLIGLVETRYGPGAESVEYIDGLSIEMEDWRF